MPNHFESWSTPVGYVIIDFGQPYDIDLIAYSGHGTAYRMKDSMFYGYNAAKYEGFPENYSSSTFSLLNGYNSILPENRWILLHKVPSNLSDSDSKRYTVTSNEFTGNCEHFPHHTTKKKLAQRDF